ncbi:hypothetical protein PSAR109036_01975 [Psychrobacter arenosus]|uniref:DUF1281 family ferredoxin-like fold protein n=1 Tax=Psychrobacter arenosus TaxID=256326 RepID=UPI00191A9E33|nr:hypothetical protein [Psychrobacter arenosus]
MPNHITNRVTVITGDYDLSGVTTFDDAAPMPDALKDVVSDGLIMEVMYLIEGRVTFSGLLSRHNSDDDKARIVESIDNFMKYGAVSWYDWSLKNWGTKWNMYDRDCTDNVLTFDTAWSCPVKWIERFSRTLPNGVELRIEYADEDVGSNAGVVTLSNQGVHINAYDNDSDEAWLLAIKLKGCGDYYAKVDGKWDYIGG